MKRILSPIVLIVLLLPIAIIAQDNNKTLTVGYGTLSYDMQGAGEANYFEIGIYRELSPSYSLGLGVNYFATPIQEIYPVRDFITTELLFRKSYNILLINGYSTVGLGQTRDLNGTTDYTARLDNNTTMSGQLTPNVLHGSISTGLGLGITSDSQIQFEINIRSYDIFMISTGAAIKLSVNFD